ncbi:MAG: hypothetical protein MK098_08155 [Marinovum sp.]|nr:hypothetical protein [Marinovum sp.]
MSWHEDQPHAKKIVGKGRSICHGVGVAPVMFLEELAQVTKASAPRALSQSHLR